MMTLDAFTGSKKTIIAEMKTNKGNTLPCITYTGGKGKKRIPNENCAISLIE